MNLLFTYYIGHQWKIENRTATVNNILRKSYNNFSKRSEDGGIYRYVVSRKRNFSKFVLHKNKYMFTFSNVEISFAVSIISENADTHSVNCERASRERR